jgi:hypothetical protein
LKVKGVGAPSRGGAGQPRRGLEAVERSTRHLGVGEVEPGSRGREVPRVVRREACTLILVVRGGRGPEAWAEKALEGRNFRRESASDQGKLGSV